MNSPPRPKGARTQSSLHLLAEHCTIITFDEHIVSVNKFHKKGVSYGRYLPRSGDCELGEDDAGHAGLDDDADDRLEAHDDYRDFALFGRGSATKV